MTNEQLCALVKQGDADVQNLLIENNLRFIKKTAHEVWSTQPELNCSLHIALDDLVGSYGNRFVSDETYSTSFTRIAEAGSILFSVRAPVGRLNLTKNKVVIGRGLAAINHRRGAQSYLFYLLKEKFFRDDIIGNGSIFASISKEELLNQKFLIPLDSLVGQFNGIAGGIDKKIDILSEQIRLLTEARNRLLPKLMSGELEV